MARRDREIVPDNIIDRAVELWCRALRLPRHDNGDDSARGFMTLGLVGMTVDAEMAKMNDLDERIERFRQALAERMKFTQANDGQPTGKQGQHGPETYYFDRFLSVDYGPDPDLRFAADIADIPYSLFSWKSTVQIHATHVCSSFGYGAGYLYHYPLTDGSWLICRLSGDDMPTITKAVEAGLLPELAVEPKAA